MSGSSTRAFTLIELMIVITIIGILAAVAIPAYRKVVHHARVRSCSQNLSQLWQMQLNYAIQHNPRSGLMPSETGGEFWAKLTKTSPPMLEAEETDILDCPVSGDTPAAGRAQYRGPVEDVNRVRKGPVGADLAGAHGTVDGGNVLLRDGSTRTVAIGDALWTAAATATKP